MTYLELMRATMGKEFIRKADAKVYTRTAFWFAASKDEITNLLNGYERTWMLKDKRNWNNGYYHEPRRKEKEENLYE